MTDIVAFDPDTSDYDGDTVDSLNLVFNRVIAAVFLNGATPTPTDTDTIKEVITDEFDGLDDPDDFDEDDMVSAVIAELPPLSNAGEPPPG
jgi:hypothetical protein